MILNRIWIGMILVSVIVTFSKLIFWQDVNVMQSMIDSLTSSAETGFTLALGLTGAMCLWLGIMRIGENGGALNKMTKIVTPLFSRLFPEVPRNHPAMGAMMMNFSANMLGLDNAATPLGLKAMGELQELNPEKETASNAQIMFLVLNTSGLTIIPVSIIALRTSGESLSPTSVFLPILISTYIASLAGLIFVAIKQRINILNKVVLAYIGILTLFIAALLYYVFQHPEQGQSVSTIVGGSIIFAIIISFLLMAVKNKVNVYDSFIDGAKEGFKVAVNIIPFLIAMLVAIALLRSSGTLDAVIEGVKWAVLQTGMVFTEWVDALPVAIMKPLSGGGARGAFVEIMDHFGVDSIQEKIAATMQGSTETTLYVLAVYFGSVKIKHSRYAVTAGLFADLIGIIAAIVVSYLFFVK